VNFSVGPIPAATALLTMISDTDRKWSVIGAQIFFTSRQVRLTIHGWYSWKTRLCSVWTMIGVPASFAAKRPRTPAFDECVCTMW
jgi:hypothetical protein